MSVFLTGINKGRSLAANGTSSRRVPLFPAKPGWLLAGNTAASGVKPVGPGDCYADQPAVGDMDFPPGGGGPGGDQRF